ncbi:MAG: hypothetical protein ACXWQQ_07340 [Pseudobdellovibrio sp.]
MNSIFLSIPIWLGMLLALSFPYYGLNSSKYGLIALFVLSLLNTFNFNFKTSVKEQSRNWKRIVLNLFIAYTLLPSIQLILAKLLIHNSSLQLGYLLAAIAPVAIVAPQFVSTKEQKDLSVVYILISTLAYPLFCLFYIRVLSFEGFSVHILPIIKDVTLLTVIPVFFSLFIEKFAAPVKRQITAAIRPVTPFVNMSLIGFLVFIYFGSAFTKTNLSEIGSGAWFSIVLIALCQDFLALYILKFFNFDLTEKICFSIKNVALSGGVLLIFHPEGILACSSVFAAHAIMYTLVSSDKFKKYI